MADIVSPEQRSRNMSRIGPRNTKPEIQVRRIVHRMGLRFRLHRRGLPGRPDIVLARHRLVVFVHGCYWHRHPGCSNCTTPKTRPEFWATKFEQNVARDARVTASLRRDGWRVLTIWECEAERPELVERLVRRSLPASRYGCLAEWSGC